jgi:hypothetical protein
MSVGLTVIWLMLFLLGVMKVAATILALNGISAIVIERS